MKIISIIGARPQFVKAAMISNAILNERSDIHEVIIHTGQHFDHNMSEVFFNELEIPKPNYYLGIGGGSHGENTGRMIEAIEDVLIKEKPSWVIVYGDTDSTLAGSIASTKLHIPIAHVEAGLRSYNRRMPEEINRILTDHCSTLLFTPTLAAGNNLLKEGFDHNAVKFVGDVMYDASLYYKSKMKPLAEDLIQLRKNFVLCTLHRAENTENLSRLLAIIDALRKIAEVDDVIMPIHPRTRLVINRNKIELGAIKVIDPIGYLEMIWLLDKCSVVITDSGGLQKEAFFFEKPCITTRDETEWTELVESGCNFLSGADTNRILEIFGFISFPQNISKFYGLGDASTKIIRSF